MTVAGSFLTSKYHIILRKKIYSMEQSHLVDFLTSGSISTLVCTLLRALRLLIMKIQHLYSVDMDHYFIQASRVIPGAFSPSVLGKTLKHIRWRNAAINNIFLQISLLLISIFRIYFHIYDLTGSRTTYTTPDSAIYMVA